MDKQQAEQLVRENLGGLASLSPPGTEHDLLTIMVNALLNVRPWVSVSDRLPTAKDADHAGEVIVVDAEGAKYVTHWECVEELIKQFDPPMLAWCSFPKWIGDDFG